MASKLTKWINAHLKAPIKPIKRPEVKTKKPTSKTPDESSGGKAKSKVTKTKRKNPFSGAASAATVVVIKASPGKLKRKADATDNEVVNVQLKQKGDGSKGSRVVEAGDRYRKPGQGKGRGLRGTNPEEPFSGKVKQKKKKKKK